MPESKPLEPVYQPDKRLPFPIGGVAQWKSFQFSYFYDAGDPTEHLGWGWMVTRKDSDRIFAKSMNLESEAACKAVLRRWWNLITETADDDNLWNL